MNISTYGSIVAAISIGATAFANPNAVANSPSSDEVRSIVAEMMADANSRSSYLQSGVSGHDGNFFLASEDGAFRLNVGGLIQFRYNAFFNGESDGDDEQGFTTHSTELHFDGQLYNDIDFTIVGDFDSDSGSFQLDDAYFGREFGFGYVQAGQFKLPFLREDSVADEFQLTVDRSAVNSVFGQGYSQGVQLSDNLGDNFRYAVAFSDGLNSRDTTLTEDPAEFGITGRLEYLLAGNWDQFNTFSSAPGSEFSAMIGAAGHYEEGDNNGLDSQYSYTVDLSFEGDGWNAFFAGVGRTQDNGVDEFDDFGLVAQGGWFIPESDWEIFGRYDGVFADSDRGLNNDEFNFLTAGVNYYMHGHAAKFTLDAVYALDETDEFGSLGNTSNVGLLPSSDSGSVAVRAQFQIMF